MQSDRNSFCGDVVLKSFNMACRYKNSIYDQNCEKQILWELYIHRRFEIFRLIEENAYLKKYIQHITTRNNKIGF